MYRYRLLQGSHSSVVRASTAKVGGLGFDSQWLPMHSVCFYPDLSPVAYHQFLPPVVGNHKNNRVCVHTAGANNDHVYNIATWAVVQY